MTEDAKVSSCSLQNCEHSGRTTKVKQAATAGWDMLVMTSAEAEKSAELVVPSTEPIGRAERLEPSHTSDPTFDAPVVLLQAVVFECACPVLHVSAQC